MNLQNRVFCHGDIMHSLTQIKTAQLPCEKKIELQKRVFCPCDKMHALAWFRTLQHRYRAFYQYLDCCENDIS